MSEVPVHGKWVIVCRRKDRQNDVVMFWYTKRHCLVSGPLPGVSAFKTEEKAKEMLVLDPTLKYSTSSSGSEWETHVIRRSNVANFKIETTIMVGTKA